MYADALLIVVISIITALLSEAITWVLVYRTDTYKRLKASIEKQSKRLEKKKEAVTDISKQGGQKRKLEKAEERLKSNNRDLSLVYSDITKDLRVFIWWLFV
jgi:predicted  nucleic acid-binding Zn-ribbon protein